MKKEVILVPKDKSPLDVLAEMGERLRKSWIFLHQNAYDKLYSTCTNTFWLNQNCFSLYYAATDDYPETTISFFHFFPSGTWHMVNHISASDIAYKYMPPNPEEIFFLKMEE